MRKKFYFSTVCLLAASSFMLVSCDKDEKADVSPNNEKLTLDGAYPVPSRERRDEIKS